MVTNVTRAFIGNLDSYMVKYEHSGPALKTKCQLDLVGRLFLDGIKKYCRSLDTQSISNETNLKFPACVHFKMLSTKSRRRSMFEVSK